jgi:hypothetical protein
VSYEIIIDNYEQGRNQGWQESSALQIILKFSII